MCFLLWTVFHKVIQGLYIQLRLETINNFVDKAKKKIVVFQVPCQKKTGSGGRLYFFFFFTFFFNANSTTQFFSLFSFKKVQAMSSGCGSW